MDLSGIFVPLVTPFAADGSVALDALSALAASVLDDGAAGLVVLGTTGEPATLTPSERSAVIAACRAVALERHVPLLVGVGGNSTTAAVSAVQELARAMAAASATAARTAVAPAVGGVPAVPAVPSVPAVPGDPGVSAVPGDPRVADGSAVAAVSGGAAVSRAAGDSRAANVSGAFGVSEAAGRWTTPIPVSIPVPCVRRERTPASDDGAVGSAEPGNAADLGAGDSPASRSVEVAAMVVVPPYTRPGAAGVVAHFRAVAAASPVPVVIYHIPYRTGQELDVATLLELASIPNIIGMKLADGPVSGNTITLLGNVPDGFAVLAGDDAVVSPLLALGARGGVLASAHVATDRYVALYEAWRCGDLERARELGEQLAALSAALFTEPNPTVIKGVLHAQGRIPTPNVRLPLLPASAHAVRTALAAAPAMAVSAPR